MPWSAAMPNARDKLPALHSPSTTDDPYSERRLREVSDKLRRFFLRHAREAHDDLSQESLLRYWRARESFRCEGSPEAFAFAIATNVLKHYYRSKNTQLRACARDSSFFDGVFSPWQPPEDGFVSLDSSLQGLSPYQRSLLHLLYWCELTPDEASRVLQRPSASVRRHHHEAKSKLRVLLSTPNHERKNASPPDHRGPQEELKRTRKNEREKANES